MQHILRLISGFEHLSRILAQKSCIEEYGNGFEQLALFENIRMSPQDAFFSRKTKVRIEKSVGKICGELVWPFTPGVPVLIPGEIITEKALKLSAAEKERVVSLMGLPIILSPPFLFALLELEAWRIV